MTVAPKRGDGAQKGKKTAPRLEPEGLQTKSVSLSPTDSAPTAQNQGQSAARRLPPPNVLLPARIRRRQISALLWHRHQGPCRTDDAETWLEEVAIHLVISCAPGALLYVAEEWAERYAPGLSARVIAGTLERVRAKPPFYQSADIGRRLQLTLVEKELLAITHIAAYDEDDDEAEARKRIRRNEAVRAKRLASGVTKTPRDRCVARAVARLPGETTGSFYRRMERLRRAALT